MSGEFRQKTNLRIHRSLQCHLRAVALHESEVDGTLPNVTLAEARYHAKMLAAFVAERPEMTANEEHELQCY